MIQSIRNVRPIAAAGATSGPTTADPAISSHKQKESALQRAILRNAVAQGILAHKVTAPGRRGWPDLFLAYYGTTALVEVKVDGEQPNEQQAALHDKLRKHVKVFVVRSEEEAEAVYRYLRTGDAR